MCLIIKIFFFYVAFHSFAKICKFYKLHNLVFPRTKPSLFVFSCLFFLKLWCVAQNIISDILKSFVSLIEANTILANLLKYEKLKPIR